MAISEFSSSLQNHHITPSATMTESSGRYKMQEGNSQDTRSNFLSHTIDSDGITARLRIYT
jgi:hypothetical protein